MVGFAGHWQELQVTDRIYRSLVDVAGHMQGLQVTWYDLQVIGRISWIIYSTHIYMYCETNPTRYVAVSELLDKYLTQLFISP